jgi:hypothetical protein
VQGRLYEANMICSRVSLVVSRRSTEPCASGTRGDDVGWVQGNLHSGVKRDEAPHSSRNAASQVGIKMSPGPRKTARDRHSNVVTFRVLTLPVAC